MYFSRSLVCRSFVVDERDRRLADLFQVVRRDVGRHADRDAGAAVDQQLRHLGRQHDRLLGGAVVVGAEVDRPLLDLLEQLHRQRREPRLGVAVGGRRIAVERAEVAVPFDQRVAQREPLRHAHHRLVRRRVAVRVVLAQHLADDRRALAELGVGVKVQVRVHRVEDPPLHRLQAVAHVGQRARGDDADRVVQIAALRLVRERSVRRRGRPIRPPSPPPFRHPAPCRPCPYPRRACRSRCRHITEPRPWPPQPEGRAASPPCSSAS